MVSFNFISMSSFDPRLIRSQHDFCWPKNPNFNLANFNCYNSVEEINQFGKVFLVWTIMLKDKVKCRLPRNNEETII